MNEEEVLENLKKNRGEEEAVELPERRVRGTGQDYYLGLDLGSGSVGWAVTDESYNILRARGKDLWGVRLFPEASTALERRTARSRRRRIRREQERARLLRGIFREEIEKVDKEFYRRLDESFFALEDKKFRDANSLSRNSLFNDLRLQDKDFFKLYPTIWHLRQAIVCSSPDFKCSGEDEDALKQKASCVREKFDIRLYFLAILHILKRRGHFLYPGEKIDVEEGLEKTVEEFNAEDGVVREMFGLRIKVGEEGKFVETLAKKGVGKRDKKKELGLLLEDVWGEDNNEDEMDEAATFKKRLEVVTGLLSGGKVGEVTEGFGAEKSVDEKVSLCFDSANIEEELGKVEVALGEEKYSAIVELKRVYDAANLHHLMKGRKCISEVMVENYKTHERQLLELKKFFRDKPEAYRKLFKENDESTKETKDGNKNTDGDKNNKKVVSYATYIKSGKVSQEDINKEIKKYLEEYEYYKGEEDEFNLLELAGRGELLPRQRGQAKGSIPWQIHHQELLVIVRELCKDYPSFGKVVDGESENYNTKAKKILWLHKFRRPYYVGPLVAKAEKGEKNVRVAQKQRSEFSWNEEQVKGAVRAWNFNEILDKEGLRGRLAESFINAKIRNCTYLRKESVAPKDSLVYQEYLVLNELNNLRIVSESGASAPLDILVKQRVFEEGFRRSPDPIFEQNLTIRRLEKWMREHTIIEAGDSLSGASEEKYLPVLSSYRSFSRILGADFEAKFGRERIERVMKTILVLDKEKDYLRQRVAEILGVSEDVAEKVARIKVKDFGRMSAKFLSGIWVEINGSRQNILGALETTQENLMGVMSGRYGFSEEVERLNLEVENAGSGGFMEELDFEEDIASEYGSAATKRTLWQTYKVVSEIARVMGRAPKKIFIETPREDNSKEAKAQKAGKAKSRYSRLSLAYNELKKNKEFQEVAEELERFSERPGELAAKRLFLYFSQNGRCAYSGERIDLEQILAGTGFYDIDHIFPYSLSQDDSLERNMVLVKAELNREKSNKEIPMETIRKWKGMWESWQRAGLISKEKLRRLVQGGKMGEDEQGGFIARQLVETGQSARLAKDMMKKMFLRSKVVLSKAGQVSRLRQMYGYDKYDRDGNLTRKGNYEFIKVRELNDLHHAKDAYLNIVVGNVMNMTFSDNPREWVRRRREKGQEYTISERLLFRLEEEYLAKNRDNEGRHLTKFPDVRGWKFQKSFDIVSSWMKKNGILVSRRVGEKSGALSNTQIVAAGAKSGMIRIKGGEERLYPEKYGGFNSVKNAFFALIEEEGRRKIVGVPIMKSGEVEEYVAEKYPGAKVVRRKICSRSLVEIKTKKGGLDSRIILVSTNDAQANTIIPSAETIMSSSEVSVLKKLPRVIEVAEKHKKKSDNKEEVEIFDEMRKSKLSEDDLGTVFNSLLEKMEIFKGAPTLWSKVREIRAIGREKFGQLDLDNRILAIGEVYKILYDRSGADNKLDVIQAGKFGRATINNDISGLEKCILIEQSPTGLFEKRTDLLRCELETSKSER